MPGMDGLAFIEDACRLGEKSPTFIAMSAYGDQALAIEALKRGAFDYISKPFEPDELSFKLKLTIEKNRLKEAPEPKSPASAAPRKRPPRLNEVISQAPSMAKVFETVRKVASFPTTVLITGETGTGKERIAGAIHSEGNRSNKPFVAVNCAAIPDTLLESELFGHVQGAFTDAKANHSGLFEVAHKGTLFLDEIADLPQPLQVKLLRALVEKEIRPVGGNRTTPVDVRVIAATARGIEQLVKEGKFREDLYFRLNVVSIVLPPLRERPEDIPVLAQHFAFQIGERLGLGHPEVSTEALKILQGYAWPGNVRELENAVERALVLSDNQQRITVADLDERFDAEDSRPSQSENDWGEELSLKVVLPKVEQQLIRKALAQTGGNRTKAAVLLGISHRALLYKLKDYGIS